MSSVPEVLRTAWTHGVGKEVVSDDGRPQIVRVADWGRPLADLASVVPNGAAVGAALRSALTPTRWDDWSYHNEHRPFPSPRAKQAHGVWLVLPGGVHAIDEVRGTWCAAVDPAGPPDIALAPGAVAGVVVDTAVERIPAGYGSLREALTLLEVGHVGDAVYTALTDHGLVASRRVERRRPAVVVDVRLPAGGLTRTAAVRRTGRRCSGLEPRGLSPDPRPLPGDVFANLLAASPASGGALRHRLAVHAVEGHADGVWESRRGGLGLVRPGEVTAALAGAFRAPLGIVDVAGFNVVWTISAPVADIVRSDPGAYPELLFDTGAAGQQICRAAAAAGLMCRPARGVEEPDVEAALDLPPGDDLLYLLLLGRPRVAGFTYDLTPCDEPPPLGDCP